MPKRNLCSPILINDIRTEVAFIDDLKLKLLGRPYVVMVGNVRVGKSTIVERLTARRGLSSSKGVSFTKSSEVYVLPDERLEICDTPGTNPLEERFQVGRMFWMNCLDFTNAFPQGEQQNNKPIDHDAANISQQVPLSSKTVGVAYLCFSSFSVFLSFMFRCPLSP